MLLPIVLDRSTYTFTPNHRPTLLLTNLRLLRGHLGPTVDGDVGSEDVLQQLSLLQLSNTINSYHDVVAEPVLHGPLEHGVLDDATPAVDLHQHLSLALHLEGELDVGMSVSLAAARDLTQHHLQVLVPRLLPVPIVFVQLGLTSPPSLQRRGCCRQSVPADPREGTTASTRDFSPPPRPG